MKEESKEFIVEMSMFKVMVCLQYEIRSFGAMSQKH